MKNIIIFGAGDGALRVREMLDGVNIVAYIDNNPLKVGCKFQGKSIINLKDIGDYIFDEIIIASISNKEIKEQLVNSGLVELNKINEEYSYALKFGRRVILKMLSREIENYALNGEVAELGVYKGEFANEINKSFSKRKLYLFDTFEGFDVRDIKQEIASGAEIGEFGDTNIELVLNNMTYRDKCIIKKGYFPQSLDELEDEFCFVSIDTDLYLSIYNGLEYFYPRLVKRGYLMIHDYNSSKFDGVRRAIVDYEKNNDITLNLVPVGDLCGSVVIVK